MTTINVTADQVRWFRARRQGLLGDLPDMPATCRANLGMQSQQLGPSAWGLSLRTTGRPTADDVSRAILDDGRTLVRSWGQRGTLHVYAPDDWATILVARHHWGSGARNLFIPLDEDLVQARQRIHQMDRAATRTDLLELVPERYIDEIEPHIRKWAKQMVKGEHTDANIRDTARRFAAGRIIWGLSTVGDVCHGEKIGAEQSYPLRQRWFPEMRWQDIAPDDAAVTMARRFLRHCGPANEKDIQHFFASKARPSKTWIKALRNELVAVQCEGRALWLLAEDVDMLRAEPPTDEGSWPTRLLPMWDGHLMMWPDKSWTTATTADEKQVWRRQGVVKATVLRRGQVVAYWEHKARSKWVGIEVFPLTGWAKALMPAIEREAAEYAAHLGLDEARIKVVG